MSPRRPRRVAQSRARTGEGCGVGIEGVCRARAWIGMADELTNSKGSPNEGQVLPD
jgi:hypothetical protein